MTNHSILLIDDEENLLETVSDDLSHEGYSVVTASNGVEGIKKYKENPYDLVITDIVMDGMDGIEVSREIKNLNPKTEVIILTGYGETHLAVVALKLDVFGFILKPCINAELTKKVSDCFLKIENNRKGEILTEDITQCNHCKNIRLDGYAINEMWVNPSSLFSEKASITFVCGVCPECEEINKN
jgi:YesN/AraC family two-component response regulator